MRTAFFSCLALTVLLFGCAGPPAVVSPATAVPATASPLPRAFTGAVAKSATPLLLPSATAVPASPLRATATPSALVVRQSAPVLLGRVPLLSLPGEGRNPTALAQMGETVYVANRTSENLAVIRDKKLESFTPLSYQPDTLAADAEHSRLYAASYYSRTVTLLENDAPVRSRILSDSVQSLLPLGDRLLVGLGSRPAIQVLDPVTLEQKQQVVLSRGFNVLKLVADPSRNRLFANTYEEVVVLELDTLQELAHFSAPYLFGALAVNPADGSVWAGIYDEKEQRAYLAQYDEGGKELGRFPIGGDPVDALFDSDGRVYALSSYDNRVDVVDAASSRSVGSIRVGEQPGALLLDSATRLLYVANRDSDSVSVIDTETQKESAVIPLGMNVTALLADESRNRVYAANASSDSVFVLENGQPAKEIAVGHHPVDLARDPGADRLFVANYADGTLSVVDEKSLRVLETVEIGRDLSTVTVDAQTGRLFAGSVILDLKTLAPLGTYSPKSPTFRTEVGVRFARADAARGKVYVIASNGIPGSNSRQILYSLSESDPGNSRVLPYHNGGNITALAVDPLTGAVYAGITHPLAYSNALAAWDAEGNETGELVINSRISGLALNPGTGHLFLAHSGSFPGYSQSASTRDNTVQILDAATLGEVDWLEVPGEPGPTTVLGDTIYVAGRKDGVVSLIGDVATARPPAPTATFTPTLYPTLAPAATLTP